MHFPYFWITFWYNNTNSLHAKVACLKSDQIDTCELLNMEINETYLFNLGRALGFMLSKVDPYAKLLFFEGVFLLAFLVSELNQEVDFVIRCVCSGESSF